MHARATTETSDNDLRLKRGSEEGGSWAARPRRMVAPAVADRCSRVRLATTNI